MPFHFGTGAGALDFCLACSSAVVTVLCDSPVVVISRMASENTGTRLTHVGFGAGKVPAGLVETEAFVCTSAVFEETADFNRAE